MCHYLHGSTCLSLLHYLGGIGMNFKQDKSGIEIKIGDIVSINRYDEPLSGVVKQHEGGQIYIDHEKVCLKYMHQIHCEVCETTSRCFFIDFFDPYELEIIN